MKHPEGRVLAVQQQLFLAQVLSEKSDFNEAVILRKLAMAGLKLAIDSDEIAVDAAAIYPRLQDERETKLRAVSTGGNS